MTSFFEYLEMSRPMAAVAKNTAGSNSGAPAVLPFLLRLIGPCLGETSRIPSIQARAQLSLSHQTPGHRTAVGDAVLYASRHSGPRKFGAVESRGTRSRKCLSKACIQTGIARVKWSVWNSLALSRGVACSITETGLRAFGD